MSRSASMPPAAEPRRAARRGRMPAAHAEPSSQPPGKQVRLKACTGALVERKRARKCRRWSPGRPHTWLAALPACLYHVAVVMLRAAQLRQCRDAVAWPAGRRMMRAVAPPRDTSARWCSPARSHQARSARCAGWARCAAARHRLPQRPSVRCASCPLSGCGARQVAPTDLGCLPCLQAVRGPGALGSGAEWLAG